MAKPQKSNRLKREGIFFSNQAPFNWNRHWWIIGLACIGILWIETIILILSSTL